MRTFCNLYGCRASFDDACSDDEIKAHLSLLGSNKWREIVGLPCDMKSEWFDVEVKSEVCGGV